MWVEKRKWAMGDDQADPSWRPIRNAWNIRWKTGCDGPIQQASENKRGSSRGGSKGTAGEGRNCSRALTFEKQDEGDMQNESSMFFSNNQGEGEFLETVCSFSKLRGRRGEGDGSFICEQGDS